MCWTVRRSNSRQGSRDFIPCQYHTDRLWGAPTLLLMGSGVHFRGVRRPGRQVKQVLPSRAEVKNEWTYTSVSPVCFRGMDRDTFTFTITATLLVHRYETNIVHWMQHLFLFIIVVSGPGSVVGIATAYGLDGPGIESRCGRDFPHLFRPALRPTQPPVQWVPSSRG
jgi:hypothetical protein